MFSLEVYFTKNVDQLGFAGTELKMARLLGDYLHTSNVPCIFNQVKRYSKFISLHLLYISEF